MAFPNTPSELFWSSSPYVSDNTFNCSVGFYDGSSDFNLETRTMRVRCVR